MHLINSGDCNGLTPKEAQQKLAAHFSSENRGGFTVQYKLRDWLFSRQRYWGEPFPIVWVSESDYYKAIANAKLPLPETPVSYTIDGVIRFALPLPENALPLSLP